MKTDTTVSLSMFFDSPIRCWRIECSFESGDFDIDLSKNSNRNLSRRMLILNNQTNNNKERMLTTSCFVRKEEQQLYFASSSRYLIVAAMKKNTISNLARFNFFINFEVFLFVYNLIRVHSLVIRLTEINRVVGWIACKLLLGKVGEVHFFRQVELQEHIDVLVRLLD